MISITLLSPLPSINIFPLEDKRCPEKGRMTEIKKTIKKKNNFHPDPLHVEPKTTAVLFDGVLECLSFDVNTVEDQ